MRNPNILHISSACYSDKTNLMLQELRDRINMSSNKAIKESFWELADDPLGVADWIREHQKKVDQRVMDALLYSVPKFTITPDGCRCEWDINDAVKLYSENDCLTTLEMLKQFNFNESNNEKEKEKMEAKKCERCGKIYEMQDAENYITASMPGLPITDWDKENYSESRIRKNNTRIISVNLRGGQIVDLCPECRKKLKNFFESGKDDPMDAAVNINDVIKKAEE